MRWMLCILLCFLTALGLAGCSAEKTDKKKLKDLEYSIVEKDEIPGDMKTEIEKEKAESFHITYNDGTSLYVGQGYGEQTTSGYSLEVTACYETSNAVCFKTSLLGPGKEEKISNKTTYPYIVVKLAANGKTVIFI